MTDTILSVGIDVGTSTTEVVFSRLVIENLAGAFSVPRISIVDKQVTYRSPVHETPLLSPTLIDAAALSEIVAAEYARAHMTADMVRTGAAIITGETARAENAAQVLAALSAMAGEFVVATAGPRLESVLAARGAGIDQYSEHTSATVANLDVGGGTTNIAVYRQGSLLGTSCLDIGGRLVRVADGLISFVSPRVTTLAQQSGLRVEVGDVAVPDRLLALARVMARQLAMAVHLTDPDPLHETLYTNEGRPLPAVTTPAEISFSGGVADLIDAPATTDAFAFGDLGVLLGRAIADESAFRLVRRHRGHETIAATVVGAGVHTTEISGSTIEYAARLLPLQNVPILRIDEGDESDPAELESAIIRQIDIHHPDNHDATVAIALSGRHATSFGDVRRTAEAIIRGARPVLEGRHPLVVVLEADRAKALGQSLAALRGRRDDVVCIDGIQTTSGDYIDIGRPVGAGRAVPVVIKTLVFNS